MWKQQHTNRKASSDIRPLHARLLAHATLSWSTVLQASSTRRCNVASFPTMLLLTYVACDCLPAGIKYLLASRPEAAEQLLPSALPVLMAGLCDKDDSVQAAAAEALVPMAPLLLAMQDEQVRR
jgi:hypothetical protein